MKSSFLPHLVCGGIFLGLMPPYARGEWVLQASNTPSASFRSVQAASTNVVWVGGSKGTCLRTTDGGQAWQVRPVRGAEMLDFRGLAVLNKDTAILVSAGQAELGQARIYRTVDGGETWDLVFQTLEKGIFLDGAAFWDQRHGIVFGDPVNGKWVVLTTTDAGVSWQRIASGGLPAMLPNEAAFAASNSSLLARNKNDAWIASGGSERARMFHSSDRGLTWQVLDTPMPAGATAGIFGMRFWDPEHGIGVGGDHQRVEQSSDNVILTSDGGRTWQRARPTDPPGLKEAVVVLPHGELLAVGPSGTSLSRDRAQSWERVDALALHAAACSRGRCWAVGGNGLIARWR